MNFRLKNIGKLIEEVALKHYNTQVITSSCSAFLMMLGASTVSLRLHLEVASLCHTYKMTSGAAMTDSVQRLETEQDVTKIIGESNIDRYR